MIAPHYRNKSNRFFVYFFFANKSFRSEYNLQYLLVISFSLLQNRPNTKYVL